MVDLVKLEKLKEQLESVKNHIKEVKGFSGNPQPFYNLQNRIREQINTIIGDI